MPQNSIPSSNDLQKDVDKKISDLDSDLRDLNKFIHENPEMAFKEFKSHDAICDFLENHGFKVTRHAYGLETSFEAIYGEGGRLINFNAEYDALPGGHMCGHNLITISSLVGFLSVATSLEKSKAPGRVQLLGTPAEEAGGGKVELINGGAYKNVSASFMAHGFGKAPDEGYQGYANSRVAAAQHTTFVFKGKNAHAGAIPWDGINALDAFVAFYNNISLLRQQIKPDERIHGTLLENPKVANVIPDRTKAFYICRSSKLGGLTKLSERVDNCAKAAALATGCEIEIEHNNPYADIIYSDAINEKYIEHMKSRGLKIGHGPALQGSTDQGNVSHIMPSIHANFCLPDAGESNIHQPAFAETASRDSSYEMALKVGKSLAQTGYDLLVDDDFYNQAYKDWQQDLKARA